RVPGVAAAVLVHHLARRHDDERPALLVVVPLHAAVLGPAQERREALHGADGVERGQEPSSFTCSRQNTQPKCRTNARTSGRVAHRSPRRTSGPSSSLTTTSASAGGTVWEGMRSILAPLEGGIPPPGPRASGVRSPTVGKDVPGARPCACTEPI